MKRLLAVLALIVVLAAPGRADAALVREAGRACAFGAAVLAVTTYIGMTPALATGPLTLPFTVPSVIAANAIIGCGITATGSVAASVFGWLYDAIF
ncbi:conserved exported hypothetical protein [Azospirillaceae bacterium]